MKSLLIMRHAKSSWDEPYLSDFERPLNPRGERDAPRMGEFLAQRDLLPDLIVSSPAERAKLTAQAVAAALGYDDDIEFAERIYAAAVDELLEVIVGLPEDAEMVLLVGHNPGFEDLVEVLCGGVVRMPTAAIAYVVLEEDVWQEVGEDSGVLKWLVTPKLLK